MCEFRGRSGRRRPTQSGVNSSRGMSASPRPGGRPMSRVSSSPTCSTPGKASSPALGKPRAKVTSAAGQAESTAPVSASSPVGKSSANTRGRLDSLLPEFSRKALSRSITSRTNPVSGRERPVPSTASMISRLRWSRWSRAASPWSSPAARMDTP